jgi:dihydrofolate reductase
MRKVIVGTMVSMDGVMQAPGKPEEDPTGGFRFGGWLEPFAEDPVFGAEQGKLFSEPFDLLLGRRTYEIFAAHWPYQVGGSYDEMAKTLDRVTKYVVSHKGVDLTWQGSVALRDGVKDVAKLKQQDGPALITQGSTELVHSLLAAGLVDELRTFVFPVMLGVGKRLFDSASQPRTWKLTHSAVSPKGVIHAVYVPGGDVKKGPIGGATEPSPAELARREKLKSEG